MKSTILRMAGDKSESVGQLSISEVGEFMGVDADGNPVKLTLRAKEKAYLDACSAFYNDGKSTMSDEEFDKLKADLAFEGDSVVLMSREEIRFMVAASRWQEGKPSMSDEEFDQLRRKLKAQNSPAVIHKVPTCRIDTGICKSDMEPDAVKNAVLYLPALAAVTVIVSEVAYWATAALDLDPVGSLLLNSPFIAAFTWLVTTKLLFQDPLITKVICPSCTTKQSLYFGDIVFVNGGVKDTVKTECVNPSCKAAITGCRSRMVAECVTEPAA